MVGIDGSKHALRAARWAALEAASQDTALRLVYVIDADDADRQANIDRAQHALHKAWEAVTDTHIDVKLESEILSGSPAECLAEESRRASMVCVGDRGTHDMPDASRGSTAAQLARNAPGTVAIIRRTHRDFDHRKWIVAVLDESVFATAVLKAAEADSTWRNAPILMLEPWSHSSEPVHAKHPVHAALERYLKDTEGSDIRSVTLAMPGHLSNLLRQSACIDQLVIVPGDHRELVEELTSREMRKTLKHSDCTLLFVRAPACASSGNGIACQQSSQNSEAVGPP
ncbi:universal stress protein [Mycolicibacterium llatzerense]|uniref:universal stress protein n=1 Tax=Mycolicibacterium llatzerense TaxID=280871 RepID=UPI001F288737|nr:universal stress protein [Mycolicibacterium llatzerense]